MPDIKTMMLGADTVIITENVEGNPYVISSKYLVDIIDDWYGECSCVPSNDAKVFLAMYNGKPINPYEYTDFGSLMDLLVSKYQR